MSRLIDELNRVVKAAPQPMGFRTARPVSAGPRIMLIASLPRIEDAGRVADGVEGADAVLLRLAKSDLTAKTLQKIAASLPAIPWGGWLGDMDAKKVEALVRADGDFVVFPASSRVLAISQDSKAGKILEVAPSLDDGLLRTINDLPVDAALVADAYEAGESTAWRHLMVFQRLAYFIVKPLLVAVPVNVTADELKALWEAGVDGVVVEAGTGQTAGRLKELRQIIGKITFRPQRKRGRAEAVLPRIGGMESREPEEGEEEEDE